MTVEMAATLDSAIEGIVDGRIVVPTVPSGEVLELDEDQTAFETAFSGRSVEQVHQQLDAIASRHAEEYEALCLDQVPSSACAEFFIKYADE